MRKKIALGGLMMVATMVLAEPAMAQELSSSGVMNDVLKRFHDAAATWGPAIESAASRLFWTLVVISMVWTFGMMALRKADIGEFFAEFVRFTIFTGFFWWLLTNANQGMNIAGTIVQSLQTLGAQAGGLSNSNLGPSSILDLGFELYNRTVQATSELGWRQMATALVMELMALAVLFVLALIAVNLLLLLASAWILLYAGVFFLGFGGSRWTSDMAINYYKTVLGLAAQLMAMVLLVAIGKEFINHYYTQISENMASQELAVMLVISVILLFLVNKVPPMISGLVSGGGIGAAGGIGNFGAGAAVGAAVTRPVWQLAALPWQVKRLWVPQPVQPEVQVHSKRLFRKHQRVWKPAVTCPAWGQLSAVAETVVVKRVLLAVAHSPKRLALVTAAVAQAVAALPRPRSWPQARPPS